MNTAQRADLVTLAGDELHAAVETGQTDRLLTAATYALVAIADSLDRLATRHGLHTPDPTQPLRPARDDR